MQPPLRATREPVRAPDKTSASAAAASPAPGAPATPAALPETERPKPFLPLRPPMHAGGALHPPLAPPSQPHAPGVANRNVSIPARPIAAPAGGSLTPSGPRQPLPPEPVRNAPALPQRPAAPAMPTRPAPPISAASPASPVPEAPRPPRPPSQAGGMPPTHVVLPGPAPSAPTSVPGSPVPRPAPPPRPANLTPGAPIAPRPQGTRLVGQPAARPIVPPRPDVLARLQQQQTRPPVPGAPRPSAPRPGSPAPGQPIFRGPIRPGQPSDARRPRHAFYRPTESPAGQRPMHPTAPLRPESATPVPTEQRRHQGKPGGGRGRPREREQEEGVFANERRNGSKATYRRRSIAKSPSLKASRSRNYPKNWA